MSENGTPTKPASSDLETSFARRRQDMVDRDIATRGIRNPRVLDAMATVRRERFLDPTLAEFAYRDHPLPILSGQTISQPFIVAFMVQAAEIDTASRVLEIGTGSGYGAAVLGCLASEVWTVERHHDLAVEASERLASEGFTNVHVREGDGTLGWPEEAPFDAIIVTAGGPAVPPTLRDQLVEGGRLIVPLGEEQTCQELVRITRSAGRYLEEHLAPVRFVPLIGEEGWDGATTMSASTKQEKGPS